MGKIRRVFNLSGGDSCHAVVDENKTGNRELCNSDVYGRGMVDGHEIKYCKEHVPSEAIVAGGRTEDLTFYIPEEDTYITVP